ncbi:MAG TPA: VWA domain-containing protein [Terriglobia bacterium]|nr:VWA domain-containing protein [Terriglobia bacterium]
MKNVRTKMICAVAAVCAAVTFWAAGSNSMAHAQQGPTPQTGETVYAPKKSAKPDLQQQPQNQPSEQPEKAPQEIEPAPQEKKPEKINPNEVYTLSTQSNLVNVDVLVTDKNGSPITGLSKANFKVIDDGVPQSVTNFSTAEAPMTVAMLVEFSNKWWGYLYLALEDAYQFLGFMQPQDWVGVIDFDMQPHILQDFTHDRYQVRNALDTLRIPGFSEINLYDALSFTIDRMKNVGGRKAIIAIVSGFDTFSKLTYGDMLKIAKGSNTPIYAISIEEWVSIRSGAMGESIGTLQAKNGLTSIARYSGGDAYFPRFQSALPEIYQQVSEQLRHQYSLGFIPTNSTQDGKYHKLDIQLVDSQGNPLIITDKKGKKVKYRVVSREGYYSPKA